MANQIPSDMSSDMSNDQIAHELSVYGISPTGDQATKIRAYLALLIKWNQSISLTTITQPPEIVGRHFGESMFASKLLPVENCRLADVGTGAGFPGLALKIARPDLQLLLIESNKKKCAFLAEVVRTLGFNDVDILPERFEQLRPETVLANVITSRAVGEFKQLIRWSTNALARRGHLILWVGAEASTKIASTPGWTWQPPTRIPDSQRRFLLMGRPIEIPSPPK
jgi:16S rRNA (guanine527-N7)-methyltransferase